MSIRAVEEQIRLYAKQLKIPSFAEYDSHEQNCSNSVIAMDSGYG